MLGRRGRMAVLVGALPLALLSFGTASARVGTGRVPSFGHVYVIIGENTELGQINHSDAPYIMGTLKPSSAWLTDYFALTHFSEANYVGMTSGQFTSCQQLSSKLCPTVVGQLLGT